jgi:hypothetical protein
LLTALPAAAVSLDARVLLKFTDPH